MEKKNKNNPYIVNSVVEGNYSKELPKQYIGNPFIEALPPLYSIEELAQLLGEYPPYDESERHLKDEYRIHNLQTVFRYVQPIDEYFDIADRISKMIRQGYIDRNPFKPGYARGFQENYKRLKIEHQNYTPSMPARTKATAMTIMGYSGVGKTTAVERILSLYPQIIVHNEYEKQNFQHVQIVWLKLDCPFDGSIKGLCANFFMELDRLFHTNYCDKFIKNRISIDMLMPRMEQLASLYNIGVLVIDELQHLSTAKSGGIKKMLNFFVELINMIGIPVVLIGTMKALPLLQSELREARRVSGQGDIYWGPLNKDSRWELLLRGLWRYQ